MATKIPNKEKLISLIKSPLRSEQPLGTLVGLLIILVVIYFIFIAFKTKDKSITTWNLSTQVSNVANLPSGALVLINGVQIGNVSSVKLNPNTYNVDIKMNIYSNIKIPTDSKLEISTTGLMSDKYIKIIPGTSTEYFKNNDSISGTSAETIEEIIGKMVFSL